VAVAVVTLSACGASSHGDDDGAAGDGGGAGKGSGGSLSAGAGSGGSSGSAGSSGSSGAGGKGGSAGGGAAGAGATGAGAGSGGGSGEGGATDDGGSGGLGGTGGVAGSSGAGTGGATLDDLDQAVSAFCDAAAVCCSDHGIPAMLDDCASMYAMYQTAVPSITSGAVTLDAAALARCEAAYADGPDQCNLNKVVAACDGVFVGHQGVDDACIDGYDCDRSASVMTCLITDTSGEMPSGVCREVPHAKLDEPCDFSCSSGDDCSSTTFGGTQASPLCFEDEGLFCEYVGPGSVCHAIVPMGDACDAFDACGSRGYCETTCKPLSDLGEPCGRGCIHQYQCGDLGTCVDPTWATDSACMGYAPGP